MIDANGQKLTIVAGDTELAKLLQVNVSRVRGWRKAGVIPCSRTGKRGVIYFLEEVIAALRASRPAPAEPAAV
jgi:predicted site-specific integrase-resolvase